MGGDPESRHEIVLTADYIAKKYGVKTGMALWQAKQLCPEITFVSPRMDLYLRFSRMAHEIYAEIQSALEFLLIRYLLSLVQIIRSQMQSLQCIRMNFKRKHGIFLLEIYSMWDVVPIRSLQR